MVEIAPRAPDERSPSREDLERDVRLELLLDECVTGTPSSVWEASLTARVMAARPFAPWEVRSARAWRIPAMAASFLLSASVIVFLAPLWSLGPGTALEMWARVMAAGTAAGLPALLSSIPTLAEGIGAVLSGSPGTRQALAGALIGSGAIFATLARRLFRRPSRLARTDFGTPRG